jgi:hypothetical protein
VKVVALDVRLALAPYVVFAVVDRLVVRVQPQCAALSRDGRHAQHPVQAAMLAVIVIEAGFMQRGAIIDDQQVALFILVRIRVRPSEDSLRGLAERLLRAKRPIPPRSDRRQQRIAD